MQSDNRRYIPLLDVLRAGAALWVVLYHVVIHLVPAGEASRTLDGADNPVTIVLSQGWLAVSLFVMLSGYSLSLGLTKGEIIWGAYLKARWLRVAPLYLVILMIGLLATPLSRRPSIDSFLMWGFWEARHWKPQGAILRRDWTPLAPLRRPNPSGAAPRRSGAFARVQSA